MKIFNILAFNFVAFFFFFFSWYVLKSERKEVQYWNAITGFDMQAKIQDEI